MPNDPQVPWTDEQWARVNQVVQEEAKRARVAATFLPLFGPLPPSTDFVREETISDGPPLRIEDTNTIRLATLQVKVRVRGAQMADPEMTSVLALFRRAANLLARLEDALIFNGQPAADEPPAMGRLAVWQVRGGEPWEGLLAAAGREIPVAEPTLSPPLSSPPSAAPTPGQLLVSAVSDAIGILEGDGHFGPFATALGHNLFADAQTPDSNSLVLPQDRIVPFLGGGPLLRASTLPVNNGVVVALGGAPVELVVATDVSLGFLQVTDEPMFVFRVFEKIVLRVKQVNAIVSLVRP